MKKKFKIFVACDSSNIKKVKEIIEKTKNSKIKINKFHVYDTEPTKLTAQIEKITNYKIRKAWHASVFKLPLFGNLIRKSILARVSLVMGNLNQAGVDILESLDIAKSVTTNTIVIEAIENIKKGVFSGESLTVLFSKEKIFPPTFSQLISVGEQTGSLDSMFASVAKYYEEEFDTAVSNLSSLIEPIMIVFMGATIGGLMIALYSPIFNVGAIIN